MTLFVNTPIVLRLLVLCLIHLLYVEARSTFPQENEQQLFSPQPQHSNHIKKNESQVYMVRVSFSSMKNDTSTTQNPVDDVDKNDIDTLYYGSELDLNDTFICNDVEFKCVNDNYCIPLERYCDGEKDCVDGSDEKMCAVTPKIYFSIRNDTTTTTKASTEAPMIVSNDSLLLLLLLFSLILIIVYNKTYFKDLIKRKNNVNMNEI